MLPQRLLVYCHEAYYFLYTATKPITFHILPQAFDSIASYVLTQRLFVGVLPQSLLLSVYCHKDYYFLYTATKPITFYMVPQSLLLSIYCHKHLTLYWFSCAARNVDCITVTNVTTLQIAKISDSLYLSIYCNKC